MQGRLAKVIDRWGNLEVYLQGSDDRLRLAGHIRLLARSGRALGCLRGMFELPPQSPPGRANRGAVFLDFSRNQSSVPAFNVSSSRRASGDGARGCNHFHVSRRRRSSLRAAREEGGTLGICLCVLCIRSAGPDR